MPAKRTKTTPNKTSTTEYDVKLKGKSDGYNLTILYPRTPHLSGYNDDDVVEIARKILNSQTDKVLENPDFPEGISLNYTHKSIPDQLDVKQVATGKDPVIGEGYAPLPHILNNVPVDDIEPSIPLQESIESIDNRNNVKKSSSQVKQSVGDVLSLGTSKKANSDA